MIYIIITLILFILFFLYKFRFIFDDFFSRMTPIDTFVYKNEFKTRLPLRIYYALNLNLIHDSENIDKAFSVIEKYCDLQHDNRLLSEVDKLYVKMLSNLPNIKFYKTDIYSHTIDNLVFLNENYDYTVIIHEIIHVAQRYNPKTNERIIKLLGFEELNAENIIKSAIANGVPKRNNPDSNGKFYRKDDKILWFTYKPDAERLSDGYYNYFDGITGIDHPNEFISYRLTNDIVSANKT